MTKSNKVISVGVDKMIKIWDADEFNDNRVFADPIAYKIGHIIKLFLQRSSMIFYVLNFSISS